MARVSAPARPRWLPGLALSAILTGAGSPAAAQEPLFLRIRPPGAPETGAGGAAEQVLSDAEIARRAREAVWERSDRRARIAIASVCTGCLKPLPPAPGSALAQSSAPAQGPAPARYPAPDTARAAPEPGSPESAVPASAAPEPVMPEPARAEPVSPGRIPSGPDAALTALVPPDSAAHQAGTASQTTQAPNAEVIP